uniref:Uncharacterized protein n=1 Tax=Amphimedon queenslandica TaxID=400682 RepID=A0A1X7TBT9_AMPQE
MMSVQGGSRDRSHDLISTAVPCVNGCECPWHPLQVLSWGVVLFLSLMHYGFIVFYFPSYWRIMGYTVSFIN